MIYEDSRDIISYQKSSHHVSLKITKPNGEEGVISHFGGDNWFGTGCFEGYSKEYLKAFYRDFSSDYNELIEVKNKCTASEYKVRGWAGMVLMLGIFLLMICAISFMGFYTQDLTLNQTEKKLGELWFLYVLPIAGMIAAYWRMKVHKKRLVDADNKFEEVSRECNLRF